MIFIKYFEIENKGEIENYMLIKFIFKWKYELLEVVENKQGI